MTIYRNVFDLQLVLIFVKVNECPFNTQNVYLATMLNITFSFKDFGDYTEGYYSVQTSEGEQISQLIAGYIDIILKKVSVLYLLVE